MVDGYPDCYFRDFVSREVRALPERHGLAVLLRYVDGASYVEIGEELGLSPTRAQQLTREAVARIASRLHQAPGEWLVMGRRA